MARELDLVVVGSGVAGSSVASRCASAGWTVAVVDDRPFGGTCANRGCDPKKVLRTGAEVVDLFRRLSANGVLRGDVSVDWPSLMRFKETFTAPVPESRERSMKEAGIRPIHGTARFVGPTALEVDGERLEAKKIVIAAGATPRPLELPGAEHLATSDDFLSLPQLPARLVFVGGGYVSLELAHIAARCGARPTVVEMAPRILGGFEPTLVEVIAEASRAAGIELVTGRRIEGIEKRGEGYVVRAGGERFEADLVVHGAGRVPKLDALDLEAGGVAREKRGVKVDAHLKSVSNPAVYAAGDAAAGPGKPLTPVAAADASVVATNLLEGDVRTAGWDAVATVAFTLPPLASVGPTRDEAEQRGIDVEVHEGDMAGWFTSKRVGLRHARYQVLLEKGTGRIVAAHLVGEHVDEVVGLFALAVANGLTGAQVKHTLLAYPTAGSDVSAML